MKAVLRFLFRALALLLSPVIIYLIFAVMLSLIPVNRNRNLSEGIEIYIRSNGVHLQVVLPVENPIKDWSEEITIDKRIAGRVQYISFGWGDKNFYYHTPEWSDLTFATTFKALMLKSPSLMHIDFYASVPEGRLCKQLLISREQYLRMVDFVDAAFQRDSVNHLIPVNDLHYNPTDRFYEAKGSYHLFCTCNTWTNSCLKSAGLKACLWTPFDRGILWHYRLQ